MRKLKIYKKNDHVLNSLIDFSFYILLNYFLLVIAIYNF